MQGDRGGGGLERLLWEGSKEGRRQDWDWAMLLLLEQILVRRIKKKHFINPLIYQSWDWICINHSGGHCARKSWRRGTFAGLCRLRVSVIVIVFFLCVIVYNDQQLAVTGRVCCLMFELFRGLFGVQITQYPDSLLMSHNRHTYMQSDPAVEKYPRKNDARKIHQTES